MLDTLSSLRVLKRFGVKIRKQKNPRLHAKLILAGQTQALVGSMNIDRSAFDLRRELGATIHDPGMVARLNKVFKTDWSESRAYDPPDPLMLLQSGETDFSDDTKLQHE